MLRVVSKNERVYANWRSFIVSVRTAVFITVRFSSCLTWLDLDQLFSTSGLIMETNRFGNRNGMQTSCPATLISTHWINLTINMVVVVDNCNSLYRNQLLFKWNEFLLLGSNTIFHNVRNRWWIIRDKWYLCMQLCYHYFVYLCWTICPFFE